MSKTVTIDLPDEVYDRIQQTGVSLSAWITQNFFRDQAQFWARRSLTAAERQAARAKFSQYIGSGKLGHSTGADNEKIDADLAREYGSMHEEEP